MSRHAFTGDGFLFCFTTPTQKLEVNGAVPAQNFIVSSSRKIKDNIFALCGHEALEALVHLTPVKFNYKTQDAENVRIGFIAEDVPELVASADRKGVRTTSLTLPGAVPAPPQTLRTPLAKLLQNS
jgi:hypothetical protein